MASTVLSFEHVKSLVSTWMGGKQIDNQQPIDNQEKDISVNADIILHNVAELYIKKTHRNPKELLQQPTYEQRNVEYQFFEICHALRVELEADKVTDRILSSEFVVLYYLFASNALDKLYTSTYPPEKRTEEGFNEIEKKALLAKQFLEKINERHPEQKLFSRLEELPTVGFEFEYINVVRTIIVKISELNELLQAMTIYNGDWNDGKVIWLSKCANSLEVELRALQNFSKKTCLGLLSKKYEEYLELFKRGINGESTSLTRKKILTKLNLMKAQPQESGIQNLDRTSVSDDRDLFMRGVNIPNHILELLRLSPAKEIYLEMLGVHKFKYEGKDNVGEIAANPRASLSGSIYEILLLQQAGMHLGSTVPQETLGGVEVSIKDPEFMKIMPIIAAAGYLKTDTDLLVDMQDIALTGDTHGQFDFSLSEDEMRRQYFEVLRGNTKNINPVILGMIQFYLDENLVEQHTKRESYIDHKKNLVLAYFPFSHTKDKYYFGSSKNPYDLKSNKTLFEARYFPEIDFQDPKDFILFVRLSSFTWLAGWGKRASTILKKRKKISTPKQHERLILLSSAWKSLLNDWDQLISSRGLEPLKDSDCFSKIVDFSYPKPKIVTFMNRVILWADEEEREKRQKNFQNETLRAGARRIIREYQAKVKPFLSREYLDSLEEIQQ